MERQYRVKHPFQATVVGNGVDRYRIFERGESLWWDEDGLSGPVVFRANNFHFEANRAEFLRSIEPF
jgi:hypothetical protein